MMDPEAMNGLFEAAVEATEEAILNSLTMAETMTGRHGRIAHALPLDRLAEVMRGASPQSKATRGRRS
jgi:D-aminopeptidase